MSKRTLTFSYLVLADVHQLPDGTPVAVFGRVRLPADPDFEMLEVVPVGEMVARVLRERMEVTGDG